MRSKRSVPTLVLLLVLGLYGAAHAAELGPVPAHGYAAEVSDPACTIPADWVKDTDPGPDFRVEPTTNCAFHQWAVREFLYLMRSDRDSAPDARFLAMANPQSLFCATGGTPGPYPGSPAQCAKTEAGLIAFRSGSGGLRKANAAPRIFFLPRIAKGPNTTFDSDRQAGSDAVLIDQKGQVVYYTAQVNRVFYDFVKGAEYFKLDKFKNAPRETSFPEGTLELKSAWRIAVKGSTIYIPGAKDRFYTVDGEICQDALCKKTVPALMAMIGLHVVGRVANHPEMVWATFEHNQNVPLCERTPDAGVDYFSLYPSNLRCNQKPFFEGCNQVPKDPKAPAALCRAHPFGEPEGSTDNTKNMSAINLSLHDFLPSTSVLRNYSYVASVWTDKGQLDPKTGLIKLDSDLIRGGKKAANTSLESFTQEKNCLHCHTYQPLQIGSCFPGRGDSQTWKNLYVSHLFGLLCTSKR